VTGSSRLKRTREDDDIEWVDSKGEKEQENDELNFKNKMLKQELEHSENKLANLRWLVTQLLRLAQQFKLTNSFETKNFFLNKRMK
jgi:cell shape-determining protein MreC